MLALFLHILQVIGIDILLSGDNAVVIALACRGLPEAQRKRGVLYGASGAVALRILLVTISVWVLAIPGLKLFAGFLLMYIAYKLISETDDGTQEDNVKASDKLWTAVKTVIVADLAMSIDNVAAVAGVAESSGPWHFPVMAIGLLVSIPCVIWGSQLVMKLMDKFPWIISLGGIMLGWVAGGMIADDRFVSPESTPPSHYLAILGAVVITSNVLFRKLQRDAGV
jgi:YjbE family integral membrane protein